MLAASMSTSALDLLGSAWSRWITPEKTWKFPRTVATMACRAAKPSRVWAGSRSQVPVRSRVVGWLIVPASDRWGRRTATRGLILARSTICDQNHHPYGLIPTVRRDRQELADGRRHVT